MILLSPASSSVNHAIGGIGTNPPPQLEHRIPMVCISSSSIGLQTQTSSVLPNPQHIHQSISAAQSWCMSIPHEKNCCQTEHVHSFGQPSSWGGHVEYCPEPWKFACAHASSTNTSSTTQICCRTSVFTIHLPTAPPWWTKCPRSICLAEHPTASKP